MTEDQIGQMIYLVALGGAIGGWLLVQHRNNISGLVQSAAMWAFIFIGAVVAYGLWEDVQRAALPRQATVTESGAIELPRNRDGHFYMTLRINDTPVEFLVDTGATEVVLSQSDARRIGQDPARLHYTGRAETANGQVRTARVRLDQVSFGPDVERGFTAYVNEGKLHTSLLGMAYLNRFERIEISRDTMTLHR